MLMEEENDRERKHEWKMVKGQMESVECLAMCGESRGRAEKGEGKERERVTLRGCALRGDVLLEEEWSGG